MSLFQKEYFTPVAGLFDDEFELEAWNLCLQNLNFLMPTSKRLLGQGAVLWLPEFREAHVLLLQVDGEVIIVCEKGGEEVPRRFENLVPDLHEIDKFVEELERISRKDYEEILTSCGRSFRKMRLLICMRKSLVAIWVWKGNPQTKVDISKSSRVRKKTLPFFITNLFLIILMASLGLRKV